MTPPSEVLASSQPDPEFEKLFKQNDFPKFPTDIDIITLRNILNARKSMAREGRSPFTSSLVEREIEVPVRGGDTILACTYAPVPDTASESLPLLVFFHGGGFCVGSRHDDMESNRAVALQAKIVVVSLEYRLAPEHPFPTAVYDGLDAIDWVAANARSIHPSASATAGLIIAGTSSGGNIANAVTYLHRDRGSPFKLTGQFLAVPPLLPFPVVPDKYKDDYASMEQNKSYAIPSPEAIRLFLSAYRPDISSPLMVPFNHPAGHTGIPPLYLQVCGLDQLRDEELIYERVLREEYSIPTRVDLYPGLPHHFWEFFPSLTRHIAKRTDDTIKGISWILEINRETTADLQ